MSDIPIQSFPTRPRHNPIWAILMLSALAACAVVAVYVHRAPEVVPAMAPVADFSAERAFKHIETFAQKPHPAGTDANAAVRDYLMQEVARLGEVPEVQEAMVNRQAGKAATVRNILVRVKGTDSTRAVALAAHYDSVPYGPGAADDGGGTATLLETLRAVKAGGPLRNDVIFIFTDAEEGAGVKSGLRGACAFAQQHPWAKEIGVLMNFDCRGNTGPAYMYETSAENGWLIAQVAEAGCRPFATSAAYDISRRMPTASDFSEFKEAGIPGLNFAFLGRVTQYHTSLDNPAHLDLRSVQHFGAYALNLTRQFGKLDLASVRQPNAVYFNAFGAHLVCYPGAWTVPLTLLTLSILAVALTIGFARRRLTGAGIVKGLLGVFASVILPAGIALAIVFIGYEIRGPYVLYTGDQLCAAFVALALGVAMLFARRLSTPSAMFDWTAGAMLWWAAALIVFTVRVPSAAFLFTWPLLFGAVGLGLVFLGRDARDTLSGWQCVVLLLTALPAILLLAPTFWALYPAVTVVFSPALVVLLALLLALLTPQLWVMTASKLRRLLPGIAFSACIVFLVLGVVQNRFDPDHPKLTSLSYALNTDTNQAYWLSCDAKPDEWTTHAFTPEAVRQTLPEFFGDAPDPFLKGPAPVAPLPPPSVAIVGDTTTGDVRHLQLRVTSPRRAPRVVLFADKDTQILGAAVNGTSLLQVPSPWQLSYDVLPPDGFVLTLDVKPGTPVKLIAVDHSYELPDIPSAPLPPRPGHMIVKPNTVDFNRSPLKSNETLVAKTFGL